MRFYVYRHIRLDNNTPFYVGKGYGRRAYNLACRSKYHKNIVNKVGCSVEILEYFENEQDAYSFEKFIIQLYKKFNFCEANFSEGGRGGLKGYIYNNRDVSIYKTEEFRETMSKVTSGKNNGMYGKQQTEKCKNTNRELAKLRKGKLNPHFKGYWVCDTYGKFESMQAAADFIGCTPGDIFYRCKKSKIKWKNWSFDSI